MAYFSSQKAGFLPGKRTYAEPPPLCTQRVKGDHLQNLSLSGEVEKEVPGLYLTNVITSAFLPLPTIQVPGGSLPALINRFPAHTT